MPGVRKYAIAFISQCNSVFSRPAGISRRAAHVEIRGYRILCFSLSFDSHIFHTVGGRESYSQFPRTGSVCNPVIIPFCCSCLASYYFNSLVTQNGISDFGRISCTIPRFVVHNYQFVSPQSSGVRKYAIALVGKINYITSSIRPISRYSRSEHPEFRWSRSCREYSGQQGKRRHRIFQ